MLLVVSYMWAGVYLIAMAILKSHIVIPDFVNVKINHP